MIVHNTCSACFRVNSWHGHWQKNYYSYKCFKSRISYFQYYLDINQKPNIIMYYFPQYGTAEIGSVSINIMQYLPASQNVTLNRNLTNSDTK